MNCQDLQDLIALSVEDDLNPTQRWIVEQHLETCEDCRRLRDDLETAIADLKGWALAADSAEVGDPIQDAQRKAMRSRVLAEIQQPEQANRKTWLLPLAALLFLAMAGLIWLNLNSTITPAVPVHQEAILPTPPSSSEASTPVDTPAPSVAESSDPGPQISSEKTRSASERTAAEKVAVERTAAERVAAVGTASNSTASKKTAMPEASSSIFTASTVPADEILKAQNEFVDRKSAEEPSMTTTLVKLVSDDPDVLIYWLIETETTTDSTITQET